MKRLDGIWPMRRAKSFDSSLAENIAVRPDGTLVDMPSGANEAPSTRPSLKLIHVPIPTGEPILRLEYFRTKRAWWAIWRPKYNARYYALTKTAIFDVTEYMGAQS